MKDKTEEVYPEKSNNQEQAEELNDSLPEESSVEESDNANMNSSTESFVRGVLARGEAAKLKDGELPPGITHEIIEEKDGELPEIRRRRFSAY